MVNQYVWIVITVGVFFVGLGSAIVMMQSSTGTGSVAMQEMFSDPQMRQHMQGQMIKDPEFMQEMMQNPQFIQHMGSMCTDPDLCQAMFDSMMSNPEMMQRMSNMMGSNTGMMEGSMSQHNSMHDMILSGISDPDMKQQVIDEMNQHHMLMKDLLENAIDDSDLKQQVLEKIEKHIQSFSVSGDN